MDWIMIIVQLILAFTAIWYAFETRQLRLQNQGQLKLLKEQTRLSLVPYLVPGLMDVELNALKRMIKEDIELTEERKKEQLEKAEKADVIFMCKVENPTSKTAHHIGLWVYDSRTRSFLECDFGKEWIAEKSNELFQISKPYLTPNEVRKSICKQYGSDIDFILPLIKFEDESYIITIFRDIERRLYAVKRPFNISNDGDIRHKPSALHFAI